MASSVSVSNLLRNAAQLSPEQSSSPRGLSWSTQTASSPSLSGSRPNHSPQFFFCFPPTRCPLQTRPRPVIPHLEIKKTKKTTVIAQIRASACLASGHSKKKEKERKKKTVGLSYQSVSLHLRLHTSACIVATAGPVTSFNIQVLWKGGGGGGGGVQSRQVREREFIIQTLLLPSCTFHLSACEIEPLPVLHIYCDPITLPHIQASDESCCSSGSAILKRKKCHNLPPLHTHRHTPAAHIGTPTQTHRFTHTHTQCKPASLPFCTLSLRPHRSQ